MHRHSWRHFSRLLQRWFSTLCLRALWSSHACRRFWRRRLSRLSRRTVLNVALAVTALYFFAGWFQPSPEPPARKRLIPVWRVDMGQTVVMDMEDYIKGVVAAEMPASFSLEALKAQAVAARTYAVYNIVKGTVVAGHPEAVVSTDHNVSQAWVSEKELRRRYSFLEYYWRWRKINKAVDDTCGEILTYDGEPILAVYHSDSGGRTEDSENYWKNSLPYLRSVEDPYTTQPPVVETKSLTAVLNAARRAPDATAPALAPASQSASAVEVVERYSSGRVKWVRAGNLVVSGRSLREALQLRSNWFDVAVDGQTVQFTEHGYGHGVGMSQYGADGMAKQGASYEKILRTYYTGVQLIRWY